MTYLLQQAKAKNTSSFTIPYDRQELADFLKVDRSDLSFEISKLRAEGILVCKRNQFTLLLPAIKYLKLTITSLSFNHISKYKTVVVTSKSL